VSRKSYSRRTVVAITAVMLAVLALYGQSPNTVPNYIGDGGKGISLTIYVPQSTGLSKEEGYIPALVQGEFVSNFSNNSAISILDWERLDDIYTKLVDEAYDDKAEAKQDVVLGRLAPTSHFLTGNITKTATGYNIKMNITATADKMTVATYSGIFSFAELDNLTGVRRASLELLKKVGVTLTEKAQQELAGAATANQVSAQTALAKGVTAQRAGTEVVALSYYYQAASFDPAMKEAVKRSSVMAANISSGNIGADVRNDILWRKKWMAKLEETEKAFYELIAVEASNPPYSLVYWTDIKLGNVNYQTETVDLSITTTLEANNAWFNAMRKAFGAAKAVMDGLNSTGRKDTWGLGRWPREGVTNTNPFNRSKGYDIKVAFELVNQQGKVIGSQTLGLNPRFGIDGIAINFTEFTGNTVMFRGVNANDITDNLTIRVASVNGGEPENARFAIKAVPKTLTDKRDGKQYKVVRIGGKMWMAENLNYQPKSGNSWCYDNDNANCAKYGRLYDWNTAISVCPAGWHLPTRGEWDYLVNLNGGKETAGKRLKAISGRNNNDNGFSALLGGYRSGGYFDYQSADDFGYWWTATDYGSGNAYYRSMTYLNGRVVESGYGVGVGLSVRCVSD